MKDKIKEKQWKEFYKWMEKHSANLESKHMITFAMKIKQQTSKHYEKKIKELEKGNKELDKQVKHNAKELLRVISDNQNMAKQIFDELKKKIHADTEVGVGVYWFHIKDYDKIEKEALLQAKVHNFTIKDD